MIHQWSHKECEGWDINDFFDNYEEDLEKRKEIDSLCIGCRNLQRCSAMAVSKKETGVWGGIYFIDGKISPEFNSHKTNDDWYKIWTAATM